MVGLTGGVVVWAGSSHGRPNRGCCGMDTEPTVDLTGGVVV